MSTARIPDGTPLRIADEHRRIAVLSWFDVFVFDCAPTITCPDCDVMSPVLRDVWEAVKWSEDHQRTCEAWASTG